MNINLEFDRVVLLDKCTKWNELKHNEAVVGELNGSPVIIKMITNEQFADLRRQAKEESKNNIKRNREIVKE